MRLNQNHNEFRVVNPHRWHHSPVMLVRGFRHSHMDKILALSLLKIPRATAAFGVVVGPLTCLLSVILQAAFFQEFKIDRRTSLCNSATGFMNSHRRTQLITASGRLDHNKWPNIIGPCAPTA